MYDEDELNIKSCQPYIVLETGEFYQHVLSCMGISHFYSFKGNSEKDSIIPLIADGCSNIIFEYNNGKVVNSTVIGNTLEMKTFKIHKDSEYFGVRFLPGENPCFKNQVVKEMVGKTADLKDFENMKLISDKMNLEKTFSDRMNTFLSEYQKFNNDEVSSQHQLYRQFIRLIVSKKGMLKISQLVVLTGYSARYINQIFEDISGMSAKQFCNIVKLQYLLNDIDYGNVESLSKLATDYNFYDMAHFIHEFKNYTGKTPGEYMANIKNHSFSENVINVQ